MNRCIVAFAISPLKHCLASYTTSSPGTILFRSLCELCFIESCVSQFVEYMALLLPGTARHGSICRCELRARDSTGIPVRSTQIHRSKRSPCFEPLLLDGQFFTIRLPTAIPYCSSLPSRNLLNVSFRGRYPSNRGTSSKMRVERHKSGEPYGKAHIAQVE
jgi:hypothetical protein